MIITKQWLNEFISLEDISPEKIVHTLNSIGHEVASCNTISLDKKIVIGFVTSCLKHPNADKLSVCQVDVGTETVQIVCGAKNVREGLYVPVSLVGATLPNGLKIKNAKLRDVDSFGMICSSSELELPKINDGILELDESIGELKIGKSLALYPTLCDTVIEVELTANRGDCLSIFGIARELKTALELDEISYEYRENSDEKTLGIGRVVSFATDENISSQNLFKVGSQCSFETTLKHKVRLGFVEEEFSNDLEGLLKYSTHTTGVLLQGYKCPKLDEEKKIDLFVAHKNGINSVFIDKKKVIDNGIIAYEDCIADHTTEEVFFEASYVDPVQISEIVFEEKLKTDNTFYRSSRGSEPNIEFGMDYFTKEALTKSQVYFYHESIQNKLEFKKKVISLSLSEINGKIGHKISKNRVAQILQTLGFSLQMNPDVNSFTITIPHFRHDIVNQADIIEEILRVYGIDNIKPQPVVMSEKRNNNLNYEKYKYERNIAKSAAAAGFSESLHFAFTDKKTLKEYGYPVLDDSLDILNPITADLNTLRSSLIPNLLQGVKLNINKSKTKVALFEIADIIHQDRSQNRSLAFVLSGDKEIDSVENAGKPKEASLGDFISIIGKFFPKLTLENNPHPPSIFHSGQCGNLYINGVLVGVLGKLHPKTEKDLGFKSTFICEINLDLISLKHSVAKEHSKFQQVTRDLSVVIDKKIQFSQIRESIKKLDLENLKNIYPVDLYEDEKLQDKISLTFRVQLQSLHQTLNEEEITDSMEKIFKTLEEKFKVKMR